MITFNHEKYIAQAIEGVLSQNVDFPIELVIGDKMILDYFENKNSWKEVKTKLEDEEAAWIKEVSPFLIYKSSLQQLKIK